MALIFASAAACGPTLNTAEESTEFLDAAELSVEALCSESEVCRNEAGARGHLVIDPYDGRCREVLLDATARISAGDRCMNPDTMLELYDCIASLDCAERELQRELCSDEYAAAETALCYPF